MVVLCKMNAADTSKEQTHQKNIHTGKGVAKGVKTAQNPNIGRIIDASSIKLTAASAL